jgi:hypothetical protein
VLANHVPKTAKLDVLATPVKMTHQKSSIVPANGACAAM